MDTRLILVKEKERLTTDKTLERKPGAYLIVDKNENIKYVGSTVDLQKRFHIHKSSLKLNKRPNISLQNLSNSGAELKFIPLETKTKEEALNIEQQYLDKMFGNNILLNVSSDARKTSKGHTFSQETKDRMSAGRVGIQSCLGHKHTPDHTAKIVLAITGKKRSEETKAKIGLVHIGNTYNLGRIMSEEQKKKISEIQGTPIIINNVSYRSYNHAANELNLSPQTVLNRVKSDKFENWNIHG